MENQRADPVYFARCSRIIPDHWRIPLLPFERVDSPLHLLLEVGDHPRVLAVHSADGKDLGEPLEPVEVLERVGSVPDCVVGRLQLPLKPRREVVHPVEEVPVVPVKGLVPKVEVVVVLLCERLDRQGELLGIIIEGLFREESLQ